MQETILWEVIPKSEPIVIKNCPKCGGHAVFENSGKFRVNANQSKLDVWLIYQCRKCKATWNMTLLTRINPKEVNEVMYRKFLNNDRELAKAYAFDVDMHIRNKSSLNYDDMIYEVNGEDVKIADLKNTIYIKLDCKYPFDIRMDKILSYKLGISREAVKKLVKQGIIECDGDKDVRKAKLRSDMIIRINGLLINRI